MILPGKYFQALSPNTVGRFAIHLSASKHFCAICRRSFDAKQIFIVGALDERIAADLILAGKTVPRDVLFARLIARLRDNLAYTPAARWAVETWAVVLGVCPSQS
jgi:hypothetical protein